MEESLKLEKKGERGQERTRKEKRERVHERGKLNELANSSDSDDGSLPSSIDETTNQAVKHRQQTSSSEKHRREKISRGTSSLLQQQPRKLIRFFPRPPELRPVSQLDTERSKRSIDVPRSVRRRKKRNVDGG